MTLSATPDGGLAGQHLLEMLPGEPVLVLEEERPGKLEPDADQPGALDQHGVKGGDRLVQQGPARIPGNPRPLRRLDRREAEEEQQARIDPFAPDQRPQHGHRLREPAGPDQRLRAIRRRLDGSGRGGGGRRRPQGEEDQERGRRNGERAEDHGAQRRPPPSIRPLRPARGRLFGPTRDDGSVDIH